MERNLMTEGSIVKKLLLFALPLVLGNLLQQLYNTVDSIIVGHYVGSNALAAVGSGTPLINLLIAFGQGAATGAGVVVSQYIGARNHKGVQSAVHTSLAIAIWLGLLLSLVGIIFCPQILQWMNTPSEVMGESLEYLRIYFAGIFFNIFYNMASGIVNATGNSRRPLLYLSVAAVTNIFLDLLLIRGLGMGVAGAAIATDISQVLSSLLILIYLLRVQEDCRVRLSRIRINKEMAGRILQVGLPAGIQNTVISFSNVLVQSSVNTFGAVTMAGFGVYLKVDGFNILPVLSLSLAATTFVGQNYGAGKLDRVKKGMWVTIAMSVIYTAALGTFLFCFQDPVIGLFTSDADVVAAGKVVLQYFCRFYFLLGIMYSLAGTVRGTGKTVPPMVILLIAMCLFRIFWIQIIVPVIGNVTGVYRLYPISWCIGLSLMALYTWKGKWLPREGTGGKEGDCTLH